MNPGALILLIKMILLGEMVRSATTLAIIHRAKNRFKAIAEDDKLYVGVNEEERRESFDAFVATVLGKYTKENLKLIIEANKGNLSADKETPDNIEL